MFNWFTRVEPKPFVDVQAICDRIDANCPPTTMELIDPESAREFDCWVWARISQEMKRQGRRPIGSPPRGYVEPAGAVPRDPPPLPRLSAKIAAMLQGADEETLAEAECYYVDPELTEGLRAIRARDHISEIEQVRRDVRQWLTAQGLELEGDAEKGGTQKG